MKQIYYVGKNESGNYAIISCGLMGLTLDGDKACLVVKEDSTCDVIYAIPFDEHIFHNYKDAYKHLEELV